MIRYLIMELFINSQDRVDIVELDHCEYCSSLIEEQAYPIELFDRNEGKYYPYRYLCAACFEVLSSQNTVHK